MKLGLQKSCILSGVENCNYQTILIGANVIFVVISNNKDEVFCFKFSLLLQVLANSLRYFLRRPTTEDASF
jgi:hypothetical protein